MVKRAQYLIGCIAYDGRYDVVGRNTTWWVGIHRGKRRTPTTARLCLAANTDESSVTDARCAALQRGPCRALHCSADVCIGVARQLLMRRTTTDGRVLKYTLHGGGRSALGIADEQRRVLFAVVREDLADATRADFEAKHTDALQE